MASRVDGETNHVPDSAEVPSFTLGERVFLGRVDPDDAVDVRSVREWDREQRLEPVGKRCSSDPLRNRLVIADRIDDHGCTTFYSSKFGEALTSLQCGLDLLECAIRRPGCRPT